MVFAFLKKEIFIKVLHITFVSIFIFSGCSKDNNPSKPPEEKKKFTITLSLDSLQFEAYQNEDLPSTKTIAKITSTSTLDWSVSVNQSWIKLTPASGTGNNIINVSITTTNKGIGTYNATITFISRDASNSPLTIEVSYVIRSIKIYWEKLNIPFTGIMVNCFYLQSDGSILVGTKGNGIYRSTDDGNSWIQLGLNRHSISCITGNSKGHIFIGTSDNHNIYKSTDDGKNWLFCNQGIYRLSDYDLISSIAIISDELIFAGGDNYVYRSTNNGDSWNYEIGGPVSTGNVKSFAVLPNGNILGAKYGRSSGIIRTIDDGESWYNEKSINCGVIIFAKNSQGLVFAGTYWNGVYKSTANQDNWNFAGLSGEFVNTIAINSKDYIFTGTTHGVFISKNNGKTWNAIHNGLQGNEYIHL